MRLLFALLTAAALTAATSPAVGAGNPEPVEIPLKDGGKLKAALFRPDGKGPLLINARAEKVTTSPAFRSSAKNKRCLIPMDGWYEWRPNGETASGKTGNAPCSLPR